MWEKVDHGGWSLETARPRIYKFLKDNKIYEGMIFTVFGNPPVERHVAEIKFTIKTKNNDGEEDKLEINGRAEAPNKDLTERRCALHTIMQLHRLKLVDKEAEDKEAEKSLSMGQVETVRLGVDVPVATGVKRNFKYKVTDSKFFQAAPMNIYKRK